jgi:hypothetical protein
MTPEPKMNVKIEETGEIKTLSVIDPETGDDCAGDYIETYQLPHDDDIGCYVTCQKFFDFWEKVAKDNQALLYRLSDLRKRYGKDEVSKAIGVSDEVMFVVEFASSVNEALDEAFGKDC